MVRLQSLEDIARTQEWVESRGWLRPYTDERGRLFVSYTHYALWPKCFGQGGLYRGFDNGVGHIGWLIRQTWELDTPDDVALWGGYGWRTSLATGILYAPTLVDFFLRE